MTSNSQVTDWITGAEGTDVLRTWTPTACLPAARFAESTWQARGGRGLFAAGTVHSNCSVASFPSSVIRKERACSGRPSNDAEKQTPVRPSGLGNGSRSRAIEVPCSGNVAVTAFSSLGAGPKGGVDGLALPADVGDATDGDGRSGPSPQLADIIAPSSSAGARVTTGKCNRISHEATIKRS